MTCVVGIVQNGKVYMGADSASASGWTTRASETPKLFKRGPYMIGYTSSFRMGQILHHMVDLPEAEGEYTEAFMVTRFVEAIRAKFKELGFAKIDSNEETGGEFLVGVGGKLFHIESDFQVQSYPDGMFAVGCGCQYALGAMQAREYEDGPTRIYAGLRAAEYFSDGVSKPFVVLYGTVADGGG